MQLNEDLLLIIYSRYGKEIQDYLNDPDSNYAFSFFPLVEMYADSLVPQKIPYTSYSSQMTLKDNLLLKNKFNTFIYHDIERQDKHLTTEVNYGKIGDYKFIKIITSFLDEKAFDFIVTRNNEFEDIVNKLTIKKKEKNEKIIDFPIIGVDLEYLKKETIDFLLNEEFRSYCESKHIKLKRGLVFEGPPGNGKSCALAWLKTQAIKNSISYSVYTNPKEFMEEGVSEVTDNREKRIFVFEDFDAFLRERDDNNNSPNQILSSILNLLDGVSELKNIVVIFTTNKINSFDSAFLRPGRIDRVIKFNLPSAQNIREFIELYLPDYKDYYNFITNVLNEINSNISFAILKGICDDINIYYFSHQQYPTEKVIENIIKEKCRGSNKGNIKNKDALIL